MSRTLIRNGYVVTVGADRAVHPGGFVAVEGQRISAVGPASGMPPADGFAEVIDAGGCIVTPGLINMHQHHWYTLFKGLADGMLLEDWVTGLLLPLSLALGPEAAERVAGLVPSGRLLTIPGARHAVHASKPRELAQAVLELLQA